MGTKRTVKRGRIRPIPETPPMETYELVVRFSATEPGVILGPLDALMNALIQQEQHVRIDETYVTIAAAERAASGGA